MVSTKEIIKLLEKRIKEMEDDRSASTAPTNASEYDRYQGHCAGLAEAIGIIKELDG